MKRIFGILMIVAVAAFGIAWYIHRAKVRALESGDVYIRDQNGGKTRLQAPATAAGNQTAQTEDQTGTQPASNQTAATAQSAPLAPPTSDSIHRNPPSGMLFVGTGKYQLYRQGDITWRLDTNTGNACILFATETQWSRSLVYSHGCGIG